MFGSFITIFGSKGAENTSQCALIDLVITIGTVAYVGYLSGKISDIQKREQNLLKLYKESDAKKSDIKGQQSIKPIIPSKPLSSEFCHSDKTDKSDIHILGCGCVEDLNHRNGSDTKPPHICSKKMDPEICMVPIDLSPGKHADDDKEKDKDKPTPLTELTYQDRMNKLETGLGEMHQGLKAEIDTLKRETDALTKKTDRTGKKVDFIHECFKGSMGPKKHNHSQ